MGQRPLVMWSAICLAPQSQLSLFTWTVPSAACLRQIYQPQSVACLVESRLVRIDPHPVHSTSLWGISTLAWLVVLPCDWYCFYKQLVKDTSFITSFSLSLTGCCLVFAAVIKLFVA